MPEFDEPRKDLPNALSWHLSITLGAIGIALLSLALLVPVLRGSPKIRAALDSVISPSFWSAIGLSPERTESKPPVSALRKALDEAGPEDRVPFFGLGSSAEDVEHAQGKPTRIEGNTWFYGESEVIFSASRVVNWRATARNPLRTR